MDSTFFPWLKHLPEAEQTACLREMKAILGQTSASWEYRLSALDAALTAWKATAEVYANPEALQALTEPSGGDYGAVPEPEGVCGSVWSQGQHCFHFGKGSLGRCCSCPETCELTAADKPIG